jgi:hypothetical protein
MTDDPTLPTMVEIAEGLALRPGDSLVVAFEREITTEQVAHAKRLLEERMPDVVVTVISGAKVTKVDRS